MITEAIARFADRAGHGVFRRFFRCGGERADLLLVQVGAGRRSDLGQAGHALPAETALCAVFDLCGQPGR
jgi:hypothetical protein